MLSCLLLLYWKLILIGQLFFFRISFGASGHILEKLGAKWAIMPKINIFEILSLYIYTRQKKKRNSKIFPVKFSF